LNNFSLIQIETILQERRFRKVLAKGSRKVEICRIRGADAAA
jgi:hypothetical protein